MKTKKKPNYPMLTSIRFMLRQARKHCPSVIFLCFVLATLQVAAQTAQLLIAPQILSKVESSAPLPELLLTIGGFTAVIFSLTVLNRYLYGTTFIPRVDIRSKILAEINYKCFITSYPNCDDPDRKALLERAMNAASGNTEAAEYIWTTATELMTSLGGFVIYLLMLTGVEPVLLAVIVLTSALSFWINRITIQWKHRFWDENRRNWVSTVYLARKTQSIEAAKDIRIFGLSDWITALYSKTLHTLKDFVAKREKRVIWADLADVVLTFLQNGIAYAYLLGMAVQGQLSASEFLLYFSAVTGLSAWIRGILDHCSKLYQQCQEIGSIVEYLNAPEQFRFGSGRPLPNTDSVELRLEHVTFRYPGSEKPLFENLNLTIRPGEKLAIVGLNGAGKTTLVKLLCGFYDPDEGRVSLNGIDIREFDRREYYGLLCAVYQEFSVLDMTIAENVAQRFEGIDETKVWECLELAGLGDFVRSLPQGLDTHVGRSVYTDGILLSGGQTQRMMLARALYKGGPILVLDEPTAALDPIAESDIYQKYSSMSGGKTSIFISHRLASTRFCDRILYLADGTIAEEGTHDELLKLDGAYAELYEIQSRYYQEGADFRGEN